MQVFFYCMLFLIIPVLYLSKVAELHNFLSLVIVLVVIVIVVIKALRILLLI